jgi:hypothetical protein
MSTDGMRSKDFALVFVATTDRPGPFASLAADLIEAAARAPLPLALGLVENSRYARSRALNHETVKHLRSRGVDVAVSEASPGGLPIGEARARQRELLRSLVECGRRPTFVWMLDDDLRLVRATIRNGVLNYERLGGPLGSLMALALQPGRPDVLVGTVHGDPPIPAMATWASRVGDLGANLARMIELGPDSAWPSDAATVKALSEPDYYYDYGCHSAHGAPALWLPRQVGQRTSTALHELLAEARYLPCGVGLTRPLVAGAESKFVSDVEPPSILGPAQVRGGNTIFFDIGACLAHEYPSLQVGDVRTRRSDSVGLCALRAVRGGRIASSDFALLHARDRDLSDLPDTEGLSRHLIADTLGAALTRAVNGADEESLSAFLRSRVKRIDASLVRLRSAIEQLRQLAAGAPRWVEEAGLHELVHDTNGALSWLEQRVPGLAAGRVPDPARSSLLAPSVAHALVHFVSREIGLRQTRWLERIR